MTALVFVDGFDKYGPPGNTNAASAMAGEWTVLTGTPSIAAGLSTYGYAVQAISLNMNSVLPASYTRIAGSFRVNCGAGGTAKVILYNGATAAFTVNVSNTGVVELRTGNVGTLINSGGSLSGGTTHVIAFDVTVGAASPYSVFLDSAALFSGASANTGNGQTSVNTVYVTSGNATNTIDDLCLFDPSNAAYNSAVLTSSVVVETQFPSSDAQTQFTNDANAIPPAGTTVRGIYRATGSNYVFTANSIYLIKITPPANCTVNSVSTIAITTNATAKYRGVIYADSGGAAGALLSSGNEVVGTTANAVMNLPLTTPQSLIGGTSYWIGVMTDSALTHQFSETTTSLGKSKANTYTSGPPNPAGAGYANQSPLLMWANCTGGTVNYPSLWLNPPLGTAQSQTHSATVGQEDLYGFPALVTTPTTIFGMAVKGFLLKSDTGSRTMSLNTKSGASDSTGSNPSQTLATSPQWQKSIFDTDPATGVAWTQSGLNAATSGVSVAS